MLVTSTRSDSPLATSQVPPGRATSTAVGSPGVVGTVTGATTLRGSSAWSESGPPASCQRLRNSVAEVPVEVTVSVTRGVPDVASATS